jgi:group II intron reverse transcriptase/maturase
MNGRGKSDRSVVLRKLSNKVAGKPVAAERAEGRDLAKGNSFERARFRTQRREDLQAALKRIRQAANRDRKQRFTSLWHHVYRVDRLREEYCRLKRDTAPGVDDKTWEEYGEKLEVNLRGLSDRLCRGAYRAKPVKRAYIPKPDGRQRPIGMPTLEDKIVQRSAAAVLQAVYEADFKGFSYGFRPKRNAHQALDALAVGISERRVNWVLDADIRGFFDTIDHGWMVAFLEHRIADRRVIRQVKKWLKAGVLEDGRRIPGEEGTPQGGSISPLLANVYLHYVFDLWADQWRRRAARGDIIVVRYADDFVVGFQHKSDAERFLGELQKRFYKFNLEIHAGKTRLIEFGRFATERRSGRQEGKPETFNFLGFTHICAKTRKAKFIVLRRPMSRRVGAKLQEINATLKRCRHAPIGDQGRWLQQVVRGWYGYYAVPLTYHVLVSFRRRVAWLWYRTLRRRSQRSRINWRYMHKLMDQWIPRPQILHPYPWDRLRGMTQGRSPVR